VQPAILNFGAAKGSPSQRPRKLQQPIWWWLKMKYSRCARANGCRWS